MQGLEEDQADGNFFCQGQNAFHDCGKEDHLL